MRMRALNPEEGTPDRCRRSNRAVLRLRQRRCQEKRRTEDAGGRWRRPARAHEDRRDPASSRAPRIPGWRAPRSALRSPIRAVCGSPVALPSSSASEITPAKRILLSFIRSGPAIAGQGLRVAGSIAFLPLKQPLRQRHPPWLWGKASLSFAWARVADAPSFRRALLIIETNLPNHGARTGR